MTEINTEELKSFAPIIPYVEKYYSNKITFTKKTNNVCFCNCIWHKEDTASLAFFDNGTYKCFGCGEHGDVITLVQNIENVSFQEACKIIGDNVGYQITLEPLNPAFEEYKTMLDNFNQRYITNLSTNQMALNYLINERKLTPETILTFKLGLTDAEEFKYRTDMGNISNRLVIPILEHKRKSPKCVGMAYRGFSDEKPKYINDKNQDGRDGMNPNLTGVFIKGNMLYGYTNAYEACKSSNFVIIVEGYFDVMSLHQAGIKNVVGIMGTSMTDVQIQEAQKLSNNFLLILDGDTAGTDAMLRLMNNLYKFNVNVAVSILPNGKDPDEICRKYKYDTSEITSIIKQNTIQGIEFAINHSVKQYDNIIMRERMKAVNEIMPIINSVQNLDIRELYKKTFYNRIGL